MTSQPYPRLPTAAARERAPLLARISRAALLHPATGNAEERCRSCAVAAPCQTAGELWP